jgi:hypothetical protein
MPDNNFGSCSFKNWEKQDKQMEKNRTYR